MKTPAAVLVLSLLLVGCSSGPTIFDVKSSPPVAPAPSDRLTVEQWNLLTPEAQAQIPAEKRPL